MSPILVRPVREQLEHDRVIRLLQARYKRKFDVAINPGHDRVAPVGPAAAPWYPDLVLQSGERTRKLAGVVEVETLESLNHLEAKSQWVAFSKLRVAFHLYVPIAGIDSARRLCADAQVTPAELWAFQAFGEQIRFTLVGRGTQSGGARAASRPASGASPGRSRTPRAAAGARRATAGAGAQTRAGATAKAARTARTAKKKAVASPRAAKAARPRRVAAARPQKRK